MKNKQEMDSSIKSILMQYIIRIIHNLNTSGPMNC